MAEKEYIEREAAERICACWKDYEAAACIAALPTADVRPVPDGGIGEMSDGYHTFNGLYYQRMVLFAALVKAHKDKAWKSWKHEDGELCFGGGWFIVGIDTPEGSYTYHYEDKDWDRFECEELPVAKHWDGHTEEDVTRLLSLDVREVVRKPVVGYEGLYFVSDDGEVTNADGVVMKQYVKMGCGTCYKRVSLYKDGQYKSKYVHRLVAEAFIPNPNNSPVVNHKDEDGTNNKVENLEWCTNQYNANYGTARERQREKIVGVPHTEEHKKKISDSLYQHYDEGFVGRRVICLETGVIYDSVAKAARDLGISEAAVRMSCNRGSGKGYKYTFRDMREES